MFHYNFLSPCVADNESQAARQSPSLCKSDPMCMENKVQFGRKRGLTQDGMTPLGLARDGHIILGAFD